MNDKRYYRVILGRGHKFADECHNGGFIGADYDIEMDLTDKLPERWQDFNEEFRPVWLQKNPTKTRLAAGLACGALHSVCKEINIGDIVLSPTGDRTYLVGEVSSDYFYNENGNLPHRRKVTWFPNTIFRDDMTNELKRTTGAAGTVIDTTGYANELEVLIGSQPKETIISTDQTVEDPSVFALEKHLEDFLCANWGQTKLGKNYDIYSEEGELVGQQYPSDTGPIDILAISKDKKELLVVELKKGRASDSVVGQIQRYMGYVKAELTETDQTVKGVIIALEDDKKIQRALSVTTNIDFYRYKVSFELFKA